MAASPPIGAEYGGEREPSAASAAYTPTFFKCDESILGTLSSKVSEIRQDIRRPSFPRSQALCSHGGRRARRGVFGGCEDFCPAALDQRHLDALKLPMSVDLELVTHQLNHRRLRSLGSKTPSQVYHDPARRLRLRGASRQRIFREVLEQFWQYAQCMPNRNPYTLRAAWRLVVETWLRRQGWITVKDKKQTNVSTHFKTFFLSELVLHYTHDDTTQNGFSSTRRRYSVALFLPLCLL
jgi:hypothetical protein